MSNKKRIIERANKRLLNEDMAPPINFNDMEVAVMFSEAFGDNTPKELIDVFQDALRKKGRFIPKDGEGFNVPDGAMM